jgi:hypothetical protein
MEKQIINEFLDYGVLGALCLAMAFIIFKMWQKSETEKERIIKRLEKLNDEVRKQKHND